MFTIAALISWVHRSVLCFVYIDYMHALNARRRSHLLHTVSISLLLCLPMATLPLHSPSLCNANAACSTVVFGGVGSTSLPRSLSLGGCPLNTLAASVQGVKYFDHLPRHEARLQ